jgi:hypothetical protein
MGHRDGPPLLKEHHGSAGTLAEALLRPHTPQIPAPREANGEARREGSRDGSREGSRI